MVTLIECVITSYSIHYTKLYDIEHSAADGGVEICVADNASTDDSVALLETAFPSVRIIRLEKNYGFADGYNFALQQVEAEYVVLLNSDVAVEPRWLQPLAAYMDVHSYNFV